MKSIAAHNAKTTAREVGGGESTTVPLDNCPSSWVRREDIAAEIEAQLAAYPEDVFGPVSTDDSRAARDALAEIGLSLDRFSANAMRHAYRRAVEIARGED